MIKTTCITLASILGCALALPAPAQVETGPAPDRFEVADRNHDGKVDRGEYDGFVAELMLLYDANRDGKLGRAEIVNAREPSKFDTLDANHDGFIVLDEVAAFSDGDFKAMDADGDGAIEREEARRGK